MQKMGAKRLVLLAGLAGSLVWASAANAVTVDIGLAQDDASIGAIVDQHASELAPFAFSPQFTSVSATTSSDFSSNVILLSNTIDIESKATGTHTLYLYVTMQGLTGSVLPFTSVFEQGSLPAGAKVVESTYVGLSNELWTGTLIGGPATFTGPGSSYTNQTYVSSLATLPTTPISVTELFAITLKGGTTNSTISLDGVVRQSNTVPLPAALPLFGSVLGGSGLLFLRRKRRNA